MTDYRTSCRNVSYCQQQSNSGLLSPGRSRSTYLWNKCWAQTFHNTSTFRCAIEFLFFCTLLFPAFLSSTQNRAKKTRIYSCLQDIFAKNNGIINICYNLSNKKDHWAFIINKFSSFSVYLSFIQRVPRFEDSAKEASTFSTSRLRTLSCQWLRTKMY